MTAGGLMAWFFLGLLALMVVVLVVGVFAAMDETIKNRGKR